MNSKNTFFKVVWIALVLFIVSCNDDSPNITDYEVPSSYNFSNTNYSGQIERLNMMAELEVYMKRANEGYVVDADVMKNMYANQNHLWMSEAFGDDQPEKDLKSKTFESSQADIEALMEELAELSSTTALTTSLNGESSYLFNENGFEPIQLIVKGIMGSCFYFQGTSVYLSNEKMDVENDVNSLEGDEYTDMQHHFDESFGYFGVPYDFSIANSDVGVYWGGYASKTLNGGLSTIDNIMFDGFIRGRAAIDNMDYNTRDEAIGVIRSEWEMTSVASALHYLNGAIDYVADDALRNHKLSEAIAFVAALEYNIAKTISSSEIADVIAALGTNLNEVSPEMINDARTILANIYNITNPNDY
jgi:hypothetical protein